jgi:Zn-dependent membrane protease YugP
MFYFFDPLYLIMLAPALLLAGWAQMKVKSAYARGMRIDARLSGAAAARHILDQDGCQDVGIEETHGMLSDHYDPRHRVLRLSRDVYHSRSASAVGIAAHEAGHALQHAHNYMPLVVRNVAVPAATFGSQGAILMLIIGVILSSIVKAPESYFYGLGSTLIMLGIAGYACVVFFQLVNLPVEFDASNRAKRILTEYQIVDGEGAQAVRKVLNAAAWTYIAATLQAVLTLLYLVLRFTGGSRD